MTNVTHNIDKITIVRKKMTIIVTKINSTPHFPHYDIEIIENIEREDGYIEPIERANIVSLGLDELLQLCKLFNDLYMEVNTGALPSGTAQDFDPCILGSNSSAPTNWDLTPESLDKALDDIKEMSNDKSKIKLSGPRPFDDLRPEIVKIMMENNLPFQDNDKEIPND